MSSLAETKAKVFYNRICKGDEAALDELLQKPGVDFNTVLSSGVYTVFHAVSLCQDLPVQRRMLEQLSRRWPAGHETWRKHWGESANSDIHHFEWYRAHGCPVDTVTSEDRTLLCQVVVSSYARTTPEAIAGGAALFDHLREELPSCQGLFRLHQAWQSSLLLVIPPMMDHVLVRSEGKIDVNQRLLGNAKALPLPGEPFTGSDPVFVICDHAKSYSSPTFKSRPDTGFDVLHKHGLDWDQCPDPIHGSRREMAASMMGSAWLEEVIVRGREIQLNQSLPGAAPPRRGPRF